MAYNYWKMMDKVGVAVTSQEPETWRGKEQFDGYIFDANDEKSKDSAVEWARRYDDRWDKDKETIIHEPNVHIFDNEGFTVTILDSAGGSSQGGRLSFWKCKVEKDGVEFIVGVNDAILADLIRNSDMEKGRVKQEVMFARRGGQPGFIHEGMEAYAEATADMKRKADMKAAKKTSKWEQGGVYSSITMAHVCLGEVWDHYEELTENDNSWPYRRSTKLVKRDTPVKVRAWIRYDEEKTFEQMLDKEERRYTWIETGKPPARAKTDQLEVTEKALKFIDLLLAEKEDYIGYYEEKRIKGRYTRVK